MNFTLLRILLKVNLSLMIYMVQVGQSQLYVEYCRAYHPERFN